jgi:hypothetical protein
MEPIEELSAFEKSMLHLKIRGPRISTRRLLDGNGACFLEPDSPAGFELDSKVAGPPLLAIR